MHEDYVVVGETSEISPAMPRGVAMGGKPALIANVDGDLPVQVSG
ncbi:MAG: hypothetical protein OEU91_02145 [Gammaproteobacteria bacterium]|nr:hypothetical protein [Gammaproteobacteria bacterium]